MDGRRVATSVVRSCVVLVFSVSLDTPSTKQQSPRLPPSNVEGSYLVPLSRLLFRTLNPLYPSLSRVRTQTHTHARAFSLPRAHACSHTRDRRIISKTKRVSFPRGGRGSKVEEPQS